MPQTGRNVETQNPIVQARYSYMPVTDTAKQPEKSLGATGLISDKPTGTRDTATDPPLSNPMLIKSMQHTHKKEQSTPGTNESKQAKSAPTGVAVAAAAAASAVDSAFGGVSEIRSMAKQLGKCIPNTTKVEMFAFIALRDLVSNSIAFVLPKRIRSEFNITSNFLNNLGTSFIAMGIANIGTTILDKMKTLRTTEGLSIKKALKSITAKQFLSEYTTRVFSIGGRMATFLALNTALLDTLSKYKQQNPPYPCGYLADTPSRNRPTINPRPRDESIWDPFKTGFPRLPPVALKISAVALPSAACRYTC